MEELRNQKEGAEATRGQQEQEATMTLRAGGTTGGAVTRNQVPRLWGRILKSHRTEKNILKGEV